MAKDYDFKGIIDAIKGASPSHLALVSFIVYPIVFNYWIKSIKEVVTLNEISTIVVSVGIFVIYLSCILWIAFENRRMSKLRLIKDKILTRLVTNDWNVMSFESAKTILGKDFKDEKIVAAIEAFPSTLRLVRLKDKDENGVHKCNEKEELMYKVGVGRVGAVSQKDKNDEKN